MDIDRNASCSYHEDDCNRAILFKFEKRIYSKSPSDSKFNSILSEDRSRTIYLCPQIVREICEELESPPETIGLSFVNGSDKFDIIPSENISQDNTSDIYDELGFNKEFMKSQKDEHGEIASINKVNNLYEENIGGDTYNDGKKYSRNFSRDDYDVMNTYDIDSCCQVCENSIEEDGSYYLIRFEGLSSFCVHEDCVENFIQEAREMLEEYESEIVAGRI